jgi:hypothetical protein
MNSILLEGLSPYQEEQQLSNIIALSSMKRHDFFNKYQSKYLDEYYDESIIKTKPNLIQKYHL